jgi:hypothetical protein
MTLEEICEVFMFLKEEINTSNNFYFKMNEGGNISAFWKNDNKLFAEFYTKRILKYLKENGGKDGQK